MRHELSGFIVHQAAVFDDLHAGLDGLLDGLRSIGMDGDIGAPIGRGLDSGTNLGGGESDGIQGAVGRRDPAAGRELDQRGALQQLFARAKANLVGRVGYGRIAFFIVA